MGENDRPEAFILAPALLDEVLDPPPNDLREVCHASQEKLLLQNSGVRVLPTLPLRVRRPGKSSLVTLWCLFAPLSRKYGFAARAIPPD